MKKRKLLCLAMALVMLLTLVLSGCGNNSANNGGGSGNGTNNAGDGGDATNDNEERMLYIVNSQDVQNLDPNNENSQGRLQVKAQIYETLVRFDENGDLVPWLAESWEYEDDNTTLIHLREGITFSNGEPFTANDVMFTFRRTIENQLIGYMEVGSIDLEKSEIVDEHTIRLVTTCAGSLQMRMLENPDTGIISEKAYTEANGDFWNGAAIGTGPYTYVSYAAGDNIVLKANENYWNEEAAPKIKNVTFRFIADSTSRATEAETGGADIVYDIEAADLSRLSENPNLTMMTTLGTNCTYLCFNCEDELLSDPLVREAIWYAVDPQATATVAYGDFGAPADNFFVTGIHGGLENPEDYFVERDPAKAKELLAQAGYPNGIELDIYVSSSNRGRQDMAEALNGQMSEAGITLNVNVLEDGALDEVLLGGDSQLTLYGQSATTFEGGRPLQHFLPDNNESKMFQYYEDDFVNTVTEALTVVDDETRYGMYADCAAMLMENHVALPVWFKGLSAAVQNDIGGFNLTRSYEQHYLQYVYFQ